MTPDAVREVFGLPSACGYTHDKVWNPTTGAIIAAASLRSVEDVKSAVFYLRKSLALRHSRAAKGKGGGRGRGKGREKGKGGGKGKDGHMFILNQMDACISQLETLAAATPDILHKPQRASNTTTEPGTPEGGAAPAEQEPAEQEV